MFDTLVNALVKSVVDKTNTGTPTPTSSPIVNVAIIAISAAVLIAKALDD